MINSPADYAHIVNGICQPLFKCFPIKFFSYTEISSNGSIRAVNSDIQCYEEFIKRDEYHDLTCLRLAKQLGGFTPGHYLSDLVTTPESLLHGSMIEEYHYAHVLWIVDWEKVSKKEEVIRIYLYASHKDDWHVNQFYINHFDLLRRFNHSFQEQFAIYRSKLIISQINSEQKATLRGLLQKGQAIAVARQSEVVEFLSLFNDKLFGGVSFTPRELELISWYLLGKTAEESATIIGISRRTVEHHFEDLRKKTGCYSKSQIAIKILSDLNRV